MEFDVHLTADGELVVFHDDDLRRMCGVDGAVEDHTYAELREYHLAATQEKIPLFADMLKMVDGRTPLIVEIKSANGNHSAVTEAVCAALKDYKGLYCIESFDPRVVHYLRKHHPNIVRGQLAHNSLREKSSVPIFLRFLLTYNLLNFATVPDFIAYRFCDRNNLSNFLCRKVLGIQGVSWTITDTEQYKTATEEGWIPIFERFEP